MEIEKPCINNHTCGFKYCNMTDCPYYEPKNKYNEKEPYVDAKHDKRITEANYSQFSKQWYKNGTVPLCGGKIDERGWQCNYGELSMKTPYRRGGQT